MPRLDAVVFTGGIGEHAGQLRAAVAARLGVLGVAPIGDQESGEDGVLGPIDRGPAVRAGVDQGGVSLLRQYADRQRAAAVIAFKIAETILSKSNGTCRPSRFSICAIIFL